MNARLSELIQTGCLDDGPQYRAMYVTLMITKCEPFLGCNSYQ